MLGLANRLVLVCLAVHATLAAAADGDFVPPQVQGNGVCHDESHATTSNGTCCLIETITEPREMHRCTPISLQDLNVTDGVCVWANLAGQTPDDNPVWNYPYHNNFACGMDSAAATTPITPATPAKYPGEDYCNFKSLDYVQSVPNKVYYGLVQNTSQKQKGAELAASYYQSFDAALSRYNCEEQYGHWNCDDCRKAYARWACAIAIPACNPSPCSQVKPWQYVCYHVVQKCPVTLGFTCPEVVQDNRDYWEDGGNYMGLTAGASTTSFSAAAGSVLALALMLLVN